MSTRPGLAVPHVPLRACGLLIAELLAGCSGQSGLETPSVGSTKNVSYVITVHPEAPALCPGHSVQLTADATDSLGNAAGGLSFTWSSSDPGIISVSPGGLATDNAPIGGSAAITAAAGVSSGSTTVRGLYGFGPPCGG